MTVDSLSRTRLGERAFLQHPGGLDAEPGRQARALRRSLVMAVAAGVAAVVLGVLLF